MRNLGSQVICGRKTGMSSIAGIRVYRTKSSFASSAVESQRLQIFRVMLTKVQVGDSFTGREAGDICRLGITCSRRRSSMVGGALDIGINACQMIRIGTSVTASQDLQLLQEGKRDTPSRKRHRTPYAMSRTRYISQTTRMSRLHIVVKVSPIQS